MTVYVGVSMWPFRGMIMCHMIADTEEELDAMAIKIGLRVEWKQGKSDYERIGDIIHYDIAKSKRILAVLNGAIPLDDLHKEAEVLERLCYGSDSTIES